MMQKERNNLNNHYRTKHGILVSEADGILDAVAERIMGDDGDFTNELMGEAVRHQRYATMVLMQLADGLEEDAGEAVLSLYLILWGVYREVSECRNIPVTPGMYERVQRQNVGMLRYLDGEEDDDQFAGIVHNDRQQTANNAVMQYVARSMQEWPALRTLSEDAFCAVLVVMKSLTACFEEIR